MLISNYYDLEERYDDMLYCFAWNLINIQGMNYKQAASVLGVSSGTTAKKLALRYEHNRDRNKELQDELDREFEVERDRVLAWKPLIFSEAMALHKSLNPC